jgi:hypothetical protein
MDFRPAYGVFNTDSVLKRKRIGWPAYGVFAQQMLSLAQAAAAVAGLLFVVLCAKKHHKLAKWPAYGVFLHRGPGITVVRG